MPRRRIVSYTTRKTDPLSMPPEKQTPIGAVPPDTRSTCCSQRATSLRERADVALANHVQIRRERATVRA